MGHRGRLGRLPGCAGAGGQAGQPTDSLAWDYPAAHDAYIVQFRLDEGAVTETPAG